MFNMLGRETPHGALQGWVQSVPEEALGWQVAAVEVTWLIQVPGATETDCMTGSAKTSALLRQNLCMSC